MKIEIYIGTQKCDFDGKINLQYAIGDIKDINSGRNNKSFPLVLPYTDTNRAILGYVDELSNFTEIEETGYIYIGGLSVLKGKVTVTGTKEDGYHIVISADDWLDIRKDLSLQDLDLSTHDHTYNESNITGSWSSGTFYRYPLINFGSLSSGETGFLADMLVQDLIPMFRIKEIVEAILSDWTINSDFLTGLTDIYLLSSPPVKDNEFLQTMEFEAEIDDDSDNYDSVVIPASGTDTATVNAITYGSRVQIDQENTDEGGNFASDQYTIPETGTYRFKITFDASYSFVAVPDSQNTTYRIYRRRASVDTMLEEFTSTTLGPCFSSQTLDTGYLPFQAGDIIWIYAKVQVTATDPGSGPSTLEVWIESGSLFYNVVDDWCLWPAEGDTVTISEWIPDINQVSFLKALKHLYNLRFFVDRNNKTIRIEPHDDFFTLNEVDWSDYVDNKDVEQQLISRNYSKINNFKFKGDTSDKALQSYIEENGDLPGIGTITLESEYAENDKEDNENPVIAATITGQFITIGWWTDTPPKIWDQIDDTLLYPAKRLTKWVPRILEWEGYNAATQNWSFEGSTKTSWPEAIPLDYADLVADYYLNNFHLIDKGKLLTLHMVLPPDQIQKFQTIVGTEDEEGFRARYKLKVEGQYIYGYVNRLVYDGNKAKVEFIILK